MATHGHWNGMHGDWMRELTDFGYEDARTITSLTPANLKSLLTDS